eukprot:scaffold160810_cov20-Tisochrysis_lutea.AAC.1
MAGFAAVVVFYCSQSPGSGGSGGVGAAAAVAVVVADVVDAAKVAGLGAGCGVAGQGDAAAVAAGGWSACLRCSAAANDVRELRRAVARTVGAVPPSSAAMVLLRGRGCVEVQVVMVQLAHVPVRWLVGRTPGVGGGEGKVQPVACPPN